ncbi:Ser/Thr protein phosphatase [Purpureocillium lavendulum]|uniref:Ser/Thr protein phosphatase n=1 Tax=Purpureocillium lavendulum TaxID=1247861 RepID=A0AB34FXU3_9HYPO|nr:Ser/Thr protein phosphatase [Purpureocillium lavendulum]
MESAQGGSPVKTTILILSDTHGMTLDGELPSQHADVAVHCGDLTEGSKLSEIRAALELLQAVNAPLKLVIAGNHDFTLDTPSFRKKVDEARPRLELELVREAYGDYGEAIQLLADARAHSIHYLDEGTHRSTLDNGAALTVYASPYTPSLGDWGFQYRPNDGHTYDIKPGTDIAVTHGPPLGILDRTDSSERAGSSDLFAAVARSKPRIHCFGHIQEGWGAKLVTWRDTTTEQPSHLTDIDNEQSTAIESLSTLRPGKFDTPETASIKEAKVRRYADQKSCRTRHCSDDDNPLIAGRQTLFVNAAIQGDDQMPLHPPWLVTLELPRSTGDQNAEMSPAIE